MWLYYWEKYGYTKAEQIFKKDYALDKGHLKKGSPSLKNVLSGKLEYLKMVKGVMDSTYINLNVRFIKLTKTEITNNSHKEDSSSQKNLLKIVDTIFSEGIDKALRAYN